MMKWEKTEILLDNGSPATATAPVVISASRATDLPAFYADWFFKRLEAGYSAWTNPFNGVKSYVSYENTRLIVFWSKNPKPLEKYLDILEKKNINSYIIYTINDYEKEGLERGVPPLRERIDTFKRLTDRLGKGKVVWMADPLILTENISVDDLLEKTERIGDALKGYPEKMSFGFADIEIYRKVKRNLVNNGIKYKEFTDEDKYSTAEGLSRLNKNWGYDLRHCSERLDFSRYGIRKNSCIDEELIVKHFSGDKKLMDFLGIEISSDLFGEQRIIKRQNNKDKGQRQICGCIVSKDIGQYNTCPHLCEYCYANESKEKAVANWREHADIFDTITGK